MTQYQGDMRELYPVAGEPYHYRIEECEGSLTFSVDGENPAGDIPHLTLSIESTGGGEGLCRTESGRMLPFAWARVGTELHVWLDGYVYVFGTWQGRQRGSGGTDQGSENVVAPMPGGILEVLVREGERVERNQTVVIMESMKMELAITVPIDGIVRRLAVQPGQQVDRGMRLLDLAPERGAGEQQ